MTGEKETLEQQVYRVANEVLGYVPAPFETALASKPFGQMCALVGAALKEERIACIAECRAAQKAELDGHSESFVAGYQYGVMQIQRLITNRIAEQL